MRITSVRTLVTCPGRNFVLVRIETADGLVGWGDATLNGRELAVDACIREHLAPLLEGEDSTRIEHLWNALYVGAYWRGGPVQMTALSGIDVALWDLLGKRAGLPVYRLLGGRVRDGAMAYVHVSGVDVGQLVEGARRRVAEGFRAVRIQMQASEKGSYGEKQVTGPDRVLPPVGVWEPTPYLRETPRVLDEVRRAVGDRVELLHDVHQRLTPTQAALLARELESAHLFFLEDPVAPEWTEGLAQVRAASATPLAMGELYTEPMACVRPIVHRWIDFLRCDIGHVGGITAGRKLAALAEPFAVKTAWHGPPDLSPVGHAASVHLNVATTNFGIQEWTDHASIESLAACREVFLGGVAVRDGLLDVPEKPGLGIDIDESAARRFPYRRGYLPVVRRADGAVHPW